MQSEVLVDEGLRQAVVCGPGVVSQLDTVKSFCEKNEIDVPDMNARYTRARGRSCLQECSMTIEHHFRIEVFIAAID
jgi:hypothetical protein